MGGYFAGIGGQKCGTSWLARYLYDHPQVLDHPIKEMHVFDWMFEPQLTLDTPARARRQVAKLRKLVAALDEPHNQPRTDRQRVKIAMARERRERRLHAREELQAIVESADRDEALKRYREYFASRVQPEHRAFGEVTPAYALLPDEGWTTILSVYPDAKFVFLMRDPVDRISSSLRHILRDHPNIDMDKSFGSYLADAGFVARTTYDATLAALHRTVAPGQVLNLFYEDLFAPDDDTTLRQITDFLDIEFVEGDRGTTVNEGGSWTMSDAQKATTARAFAHTYEAVEQHMGRLPERWHEHLARA